MSSTNDTYVLFSLNCQRQVKAISGIPQQEVENNSLGIWKSPNKKFRCNALWTYYSQSFLRRDRRGENEATFLKNSQMFLSGGDHIWGAESTVRSQS